MENFESMMIVDMCIDNAGLLMTFRWGASWYGRC